MDDNLFSFVYAHVRNKEQLKEQKKIFSYESIENCRVANPTARKKLKKNKFTLENEKDLVSEIIN